MFGFIKKCFFYNNDLFYFQCIECKCVSMNIQECKIRSEIINVNTNDPIFYPYSITKNRSKGSCNTINDPYAKLCVPDT